MPDNTPSQKSELCVTEKYLSFALSGMLRIKMTSIYLAYSLTVTCSSSLRLCVCLCSSTNVLMLHMKSKQLIWYLVIYIFFCTTTL